MRSSGIPADAGDEVRDRQDQWESVFSQGDLLVALKRVERSKSPAGVDGLGMEDIRGWLFEQWEETLEALDAGAYAPLPVRHG
ncbi:hypothetical protein ACT3UQ_18190 [Glutamicibacter sp. AOP12-B1-11]|uniref:hypothetical protein n=1 Tax=Micrococcaceae TaxID=1268 RepID=UPI0021571221|nr:MULTISPECIES: hypothetical protein [unclassified Arthrobacter]